MQYKLTRDRLSGASTDSMILQISEDGTITNVPNEPANRDWQEYQAWLALGNEPDPADEV